MVLCTNDEKEFVFRSFLNGNQSKRNIQSFSDYRKLSKIKDNEKSLKRGIVHKILKL